MSSAIENCARRAAHKIGLRAVKSTWRRDSIDNYGGFQLVDAFTPVSSRNDSQPPFFKHSRYGKNIPGIIIHNKDGTVMKHIFLTVHHPDHILLFLGQIGFHPM